jgi:WD40 repeat protein
MHKFNIFLFCGHQSGSISIWSAISESPFLQKIKTFKIHYNGINKIICDTQKEKDKIILISCSSDKTLKVHSLENKDRICINLVNFNDEVIDIRIVNYFDKKNNYYIVSLKNGVLKILDSSFKEIYDIPSSYQKTRFVLGIEKEENENDNSKGDFLLITEGKNLHKYCWIKDKIQK